MRDYVTPYLAGETCADIAARYGVDPETVRYHLRRQGVTLRSRSYRKPMPVPTWDEFFASRTRAAAECINWKGSRDKSGYGRLNCRALPGLVFAHRVSWRLAYGEFDHSLRVLHKCDNPSCVRPSHLFLGTQADNVADMVAKGRIAPPTIRFGASNPQSRLTDDTVRQIRRAVSSGECSQIEAARLFAVSPMTVSRAVRRQSWSHVE